jgi:deoxyribose-phosphate aldolase
MVYLIKMNSCEENKMDIKEILSKCDHTLLLQTSTWDEIRAVCDDGIKYGCASVCIPGCFVKAAKEYVGDRLKICTVIGFPNGNSSQAVKAYEAASYVENGADEIDMVINVGLLKEKRYGAVLEEINAVKSSCFGRTLKVIIETCLLTDEEKVKMCEIVSASDADYIKTSTGFSTGGATLADVELFASHMKNGKKIKAAGGISSIADAEAFIKAGADRLGTSKIVKIAKNEKIGLGY